MKFNGALRNHGLLGPDGSPDFIGSQADGTSRYYFLKDHPSVDGQVSGSVRTTVDFSNTALGYDDYYPFGNVMPGRSSSSSTPDDDYKFTGHTLSAHRRKRDAELDLDYSSPERSRRVLARNYDPLIGRFMQVDPLAMDYPSITPYGYVLNNPMGLVDSDGKQPRPPYSFGFDFKTTFQSLLSNYDPTFLGRYARAESYGQLEMEVAVDALDAGIATADAISIGTDIVENVALSTALISPPPLAAGALAVAAPAGIISTVADGTSVALEYGKAFVTNSSFSKADAKFSTLLVSSITGIFGKQVTKGALKHFESATRSDIPIKNSLIFNNKFIESSGKLSSEISKEFN